MNLSRKKEHSKNRLPDIIGKLVRANVNIGYYDHLRYDECLKTRGDVDGDVLYESAKKVREINESRSALKNELDSRLRTAANENRWRDL